MDVTNVFYDTLSASLFSYKGKLSGFIDNYISVAGIGNADDFRHAFRSGQGIFAPAWLLPWFIARETSALTAHRFNSIGRYIHVACEPLYKRDNNVAYLDSIRIVPALGTQRDIGGYLAYLYVSIAVDVVWDTLESIETLRFASSLVMRARAEEPKANDEWR